MNLSVVIPLFNKESTIERAVRSILNQQPPPGEILVIDDGSTDKGAEVVRRINDPRLTFLAQDNRGVAAARNKGASLATSGLIAFLDADDEWLPGMTGHLFSLVNDFPEADFYSVRFARKVGERIVVPPVALPDDFRGFVPDFINTYRKGYGLINASTACFRREFFQQLGGFPEGESSGEDLYLWLRAALEGRGAFDNKTCVLIHNDPVLSRTRRERAIPCHIPYFIERLKDLPEGKRKAIRQFLIQNIKIQWAASKLEKNRWQRKVLRKEAKKISPILYGTLILAELLPPSVFRLMRRLRNDSLPLHRLKNPDR